MVLSMKTMIRSLSLRGLLLGMLFTPALAQEADKEEEWEPKRIGEMDYLSLEQVAEFYKFGSVKRDGPDLLLTAEKDNGKATLRAKFSVGSTDCQISGVNLILEQEVKEAEGNPFISRSDLGRFIDPILRPNRIKNASNFNTVVLDPAFGGKDQGPQTELGSAAQHTLAIAMLCRDELDKRGFKVVMTRTDDQDLPVVDRVALANAVEGEAIFISITFGSDAGALSGVGTSASMPPTDMIAERGEGMSAASLALGVATHGSVLRRLGTNAQDFGLHGERRSVLKDIRHPSVVVNAGNLANDYGARLAANDKYRQGVATGLADGVTKYRQAVTRQAGGQ